MATGGIVKTTSGMRKKKVKGLGDINHRLILTYHPDGLFSGRSLKVTWIGQPKNIKQNGFCQSFLLPNCKWRQIGIGCGTLQVAWRMPQLSVVCEVNSKYIKAIFTHHHRTNSTDSTKCSKCQLPRYSYATWNGFVQLHLLSRHNSTQIWPKVKRSSARNQPHVMQ